MIPWRISMTVLTDLSASMFAACFMILLIFLSLVQKNEPAPSKPQPLEARQAFVVTRQQALAPAAMVDQLFAHGREGTSLDLFADRIEIRVPGRKEARRLSGGDLASALGRLAQGAPPVRLQVFSNALYNQVAGALEAKGVPFTELTVPAGLRDPERPSLAWVPAFLQMGETATDRQTFRTGLAALLQGAADRASAAKPIAMDVSAMASTTSGLLERIVEWIGRFSRIFCPLAGLACVAWIERRRFRAIRDT